MRPFRRRAAVVMPLILVVACSVEADEADANPPRASSTRPEATTTTTTGTSTPTTVPPTTTAVTVEEPTFETFADIDTIGDFSGLTASGKTRWLESVPVEEVMITSTADGSKQPAWWLPPEGEGRPLLVILHSWSSDYRQHAGIPYAMWASENGWAVIAPNFRGVNDDPEAVGSDLAVQDVADAIDFAVSQDGVDPELVFTVGYSGGGMMSLLIAGRHPDKVTGVAAWGPPYDLIWFYEQSVDEGRAYADQIRAACGGNPTSDPAAEEECLHRSPMTHLDGARDEGVAIMIGHGIRDHLLNPRQSAIAFNQLADEEDRLTDEQLEQIGRSSLPEVLQGSIEAETFFGDGDPEPVFSRQSAGVLLVYMDSDHEMVYEAAVRWIASLLP
ncbi:MAG TPA: alpha/beta fold hydrolase [Acidimicrobiia bacterium]